MTTSLQNKERNLELEVKDIAERLLSAPVAHAQRLGGGMNSRLYRVADQKGGQYVIKFYHRADTGRRNRLTTEFSSLTFLWQNGVRSIAEPLAMDEHEGCALYRFVAGGRIPSGQVTGADVKQAVEFLNELKALREKASDFPPASEAFFSVSDVNQNLTTRLERLKAVKEGGPAYEALKDYLEREFVPFRESLVDWAQKKLARSGVSFDERIPGHEKTLSPSDFGFHNAVKDKNGRIVFLDFEHFGWDDPAKTVSDFVLHPAMELGGDLKTQFVSGVLALFEDSQRLKARIEVLYPMFGLKWCLIFLNEFVPEDFRRRHFSQMESVDKAEILKGQLAKAQRMLNRIKRTHEKFPYTP